MKATRRQVLAGLGAGMALYGCKDLPPDSAEPTPVRPDEPPRWTPEGQVDSATFPCGVQVCDVETDTALISVRSEEPAALVLATVVGEAWEVLSPGERLVPSGGRIVTDLSGLSPDTPYSLCFYTDDGRRSEVTRFRSAVAADGFRVLRFGATSCLGSANPEWGNLGQAAGESLDFFLLLGDTVYADGAQTLEQYRGYWQTALSTPSLLALSGSTSFVVTWDDHEVADAWVVDGNVSAERAQAARQAMSEAVPNLPGGGEYGIYRSIRWGELIEIFVLDCRGERDVAATRILSEEQIAWLIAGLNASTAQLKLVLSSVHMADHSALFGGVYQEDRWQGYPDQRSRVVAAIAAVPGAVVITGDMHYSALSYLDPAGGDGAAVAEVAVGPAGSRINPLVAFYEGDRSQYPILLATWTCSIFEFDPGRGTLKVSFVDDAGAVLAEQELVIG